MPRPYDPFDPELQRDPYPVYSALRAEAPVHHDAARDVWSVATHDGVLAALADPASFASSADAPDIRARSYGMREADYVAGDSSRHDALRVALRPLLGRPAQAELTALVDDVVTELAADVRARAECDLAQDLARRIPTLVLCDVLGLDRADEADIAGWVDALFRRDAYTPTVPTAASDAYFALRAYLEQVALAPGAGMALLREAQRADVISHDEVIDIALLLLGAGIKTTSALIGSMLSHLAMRPEQQRLALEGTVTPSAVVEESLRFDAPAQFVVRETTARVELLGTTLPAGALVLLLLGSGNRDERRYDDAARFDCTRAHKPHLALSARMHFCAGAWLARAEAAAVVAIFSRTVASFELTGPLERVLTPAERELGSIPVAVTPR